MIQIKAKRVVQTIVVLALLVALAVFVSPWPSALAIRWVFERGGATTNQALAAHAPRDTVARLALRYDAHDPDALLDLYTPAPAQGAPRLTIVWFHGGGFVAGHRGEVANYARMLAGLGYAVASVDYALAPGAHYPVPVRQGNAALAWLSANAGRLGIPGDRIVLGGDSAGAQIAAQLAALTTTPAYAQRTSLAPGIEPRQLVGTVLFCGPHDGAQMVRPGASWFTRTVVWAYFGRRDSPQRQLDEFSIVRHVSPAFPPSFVSAGNGDPLAPQSLALADALRAKGVRTDTLFFPNDLAPPLPHEYQFDWKRPQARDAFARVRAFLRTLEPGTPRAAPSNQIR